MKAVSGIPEHSKSSIDYINTLLPKPFDNSNVHRNDGLIAFDEVGQKSLISWGEGFVTINWVLDDKGEVDLDNTTFDFDVFFTMQEDKLHTDWDVPKSVIKQLKKFNYLIDLTDIPVASADIFKSELKLLRKNLKKYLDDHSIEEQYDWWYDKEIKLFRSIIQ